MSVPVMSPPPDESDVCRRASAAAAWNAAIAALNDRLQTVQRQRALNEPTDPTAETSPLGVILAGPTPIVRDTACLEQFAHWMLVPHSSLDRWNCLPGDFANRAQISDRFGTVSLCDEDPLTDEQFCLVLTREFSLVMLLDPGSERTDRDGSAGGSRGSFEYSFDPVVVERAWHTLRSRIVLREATKLDAIDQAVTPFHPVEPHYRTVMTFGQSLLQHLQHQTAAATHRADRVARSQTVRHHRRTVPQRPSGTANTPNFHLRALSGSPEPEAPRGENKRVDLELLTALAHEVRTPLATIQTLVKILLRRKSLAEDLRPWVEQIERECSDQIDRFGLIFRAVGLETAPKERSSVMLTKTPLKTAIDSCIPRWQKQASRRNLQLDIVLPQHMPQVVSDPSLLDRILTNTIEHFTSQLPVGSGVRVEIGVAGDRLKLQLKSKAPNIETPDSDRESNEPNTSPLKAIGQLLTFQPETGSISLNLAVTKNIFQALGGKLTVRRRPQNGQVVTIFLPLE